MSAFMRSGCLILLAFALPAARQAGQGPTIPAPFPPQEPSRPGLPIDQPPVVVHHERQQPPNLKQMKKQADELARLAQSVSPEIDKMAKGEMPKALIPDLKRITKLSKQLRREVAR